MYTVSFWKGAADRAVKSLAQQLLLLWGGTEMFNALQIDVGPAFGMAVGAAVLSVLTSIVSAPAGDPGSTSLLPGAA